MKGQSKTLSKICYRKEFPPIYMQKYGKNAILKHPAFDFFMTGPEQMLSQTIV